MAIQRTIESWSALLDEAREDGRLVIMVYVNSPDRWSRAAHGLRSVRGSTGVAEASASAVGQPVSVVLASFGNPESPSTWSGAPAGVFSALRELGVVTRGLDLKLPPGIEQAVLAGGAARTRNRVDARGAALPAAVRSWLARRQLKGARLDGVIQWGTNFALPEGIPYVTWEDMTVRQACAYYPFFSRMSAQGIESWEKRRTNIYARARMCAVASHWAAESLLTDYGLRRERIAVVGCGANHVLTATARAWQPPRFLFVGMEWERKGGPLLLRAFSRVRAVCPEAVLDVVGVHPQLQQAGVRTHGVLSRERSADRELVAQLFARATCLVMPSVIEPLGIVHIEAASVGVPSIVTTEGGARDTIGADGGVIIEPDDEERLVEAMLRLTKSSTARRMGEAAYEQSRLYTWTKVAERLLRALNLPAPDGRTLAEFL